MRAIIWFSFEYDGKPHRTSLRADETGTLYWDGTTDLINNLTKNNTTFHKEPSVAQAKEDVENAIHGYLKGRVQNFKTSWTMKEPYPVAM